jgi:DHA2 family multidrug resistance protein
MGEALLTQSRPSSGKPPSLAERPSYKWWVTWTIMLGAFLFAIDTTIVSIAVPNIMTSISADLNQIQWVLIIYMIGMAVVMPTVGWLSDMMGYKWLYIWSLALFTVSSALCGMAWSPQALIFFRFIQGLGAGSIAPTAMAVIFRVFPPQQRGLGMGVYSLGWTFGPILGPTLGGYLTDTISWRAIFYINIPIGIIGVGLALVVMAADLSLRRPRRLDLLGLVTMTTFVVTVLLALSQGNIEGWNSHYILSLFLMAAGSLTFFLVIELCVRDPLVDLHLYRNPTYTVATLVGMLLGFGMFAQNLLVPLFLQDYLEHTALQAAILMLPGIILTGAFSPLVGKLSDQFNPRHFLVLGFLLAAASSFWFAWMGPQPEASTLIWALLVRAGLGFVFPPLMNLGLRTLAREEISAASGLSNITRQIAGMAGIAMAGVLLQRWHYTHHLTGSEHLAFSGRELDHTEQRLAWLLQTAGEVGGLLEVKMQAMLSRYLTLESLVIAFQDCFIIVGWVFIAAALASLCIPGGADNHS